MKKIKLVAYMELADGLSLDEAEDALFLANRTAATNFIRFYIQPVDMAKTTWRLVGVPRNVAEANLEYPDHFVIEMPDGPGEINPDAEILRDNTPADH